MKNHINASVESLKFIILKWTIVSPCREARAAAAVARLARARVPLTSAERRRQRAGLREGRRRDDGEESGEKYVAAAPRVCLLPRRTVEPRVVESRGPRLGGLARVAGRRARRRGVRAGACGGACIFNSA
jgi:hypothetical protein